MKIVPSRRALRVVPSLVVGLVAVASTVTLTAGWGESALPVLSTPPECPLPKVIKIKTDMGYVYESEVPDADRIADIPEFHDCQRLVDPGGLKYGALTAVYAKYRLETVWTTLVRLDSIATSARARLGVRRIKRDSIEAVARARVDSGYRATAQTLPSRRVVTNAFNIYWQYVLTILVTQSQRRALLSASIRAWDGAYPALGIAKGWNCLYLYDTESPNPSALMVSYGDKNDCVDQVPAETTAANITPLNVKRVTVPGSKVADYPPVARWEWDDKLDQQYIGIMCDAWCEVGPRKTAGGPQVTSAAAYIATAAAPGPILTPQERVASIKGWFDEESLAPSVTNYGSAPTVVRGTVFPHPKLGEYTIASDFLPDQWVPVAEVGLTQNDPLYGTKFSFFSDPISNTRPLDRQIRTVIHLCQGLGCIPADKTVDECDWPQGEDKPPLDKRWYARVGVDRRTAVYKCVIRRPHDELQHDDATPIPIPGTTRWRWMKNDQTVWVRCDQGCCEVIQ